MITKRCTEVLTKYLYYFCKSRDIKDIKISFQVKGKTLITDYNIKT